MKSISLTNMKTISRSCASMVVQIMILLIIVIIPMQIGFLSILVKEKPSSLSKND